MTRREILNAVAKLLDSPDVIVRIHRELTAEQINDAYKNPPINVVTGKRVTFMISATQDS